MKGTLLEIRDGGVNPSDDIPGFTSNKLSIRIGEGNLTWTEKRNIAYKLDKGVLYDVALGDESPIDVRFDFMWEYIKGSTESGADPTIEDALKQTGNASTWISAFDPLSGNLYADPCKPYAVHLMIERSPCFDTDELERIYLGFFHYNQFDHDPRGGTVSCTGTCNEAVARSRRVPNQVTVSALVGPVVPDVTGVYTYKYMWEPWNSFDFTSPTPEMMPVYYNATSGYYIYPTWTTPTGTTRYHLFQSLSDFTVAWDQDAIHSTGLPYGNYSPDASGPPLPTGTVTIARTV